MSESQKPNDGAWKSEERRRAILKQCMLCVDLADRAAARREFPEARKPWRRRWFA